MTSESRLERPHDRVADSGERGLWPGNRADSINDLVRLRIDEHLKELFAALRVVRQCSVGEAKPSDIIETADTVENTATVQGPEPQVTDENHHDGSNRHGRMPRECFDPTDVELLPRDECGSCSLEVGFAAPNSDNRLIDALAR